MGSEMFKIIKVPAGLGEPDRSGIEEGPGVLAGALASCPGVQRGFLEIAIPAPHPSHRAGEFARAKHLPEVREVCARLADRTAAVLRAGQRPLVLMGDDSSAIGLAYGLYAAGRRFGIAWFDAHGDLNTPATTPSGCLYGMGLAHILGHGHPQLLALNKGLPAVEPKNALLIGQRALDPGEVGFIKANDVTLLSPPELRKGNLQSAIARLKLNGVKGLVLHFDLDVIDPKESVGVRSPVPGGILVNELCEAVKRLKREFSITGVSIANYNPSKDKGKHTLGIVSKLVQLIL